jgi:hypothetical protein
MLSDMLSDGGFQNCHMATGGPTVTSARTVQPVAEAVPEKIPTAAMARTHPLAIIIFM